tara:strand:- start:18 stop:329 length:312 start_codon:yes stop_codon:yes gene_type:complete
VVIAPVIVLGELALRVDGAAEFATAYHEGVLEQASLLEVSHEGCGGLVHVFALLANLGGEGAVLVPTPVKELDVGDPAFGEAAGDETIVGEGAFAASVLAVEV